MPGTDKYKNSTGVSDLARAREASSEVERALQQTQEQVQHLRSLLEDALIGISRVDPHGQFVSASDTFAEMLGYQPDDLAHEPWQTIVYPDDRTNGLAAYERACREGHAEFEGRALRKDGTTFDKQVLMFKAYDRNGEFIGHHFFLKDITERKQAEKALRASEERFRFLFHENPCMYFMADAEGNIVSVNRCGADQLGYASAELVGRPLTDVYVEDGTAPTLKDRLSDCTHEPGAVQRWEGRKRRRDGTTFWVRESARMVPDADNYPRILIVCEDITEARALSEQLTYQASHDALTGLINRQAFEQRLTRVLETTRAKHTEDALCYLDLDQFKVINDTCGHVAGDELLRQLGTVLKAEVRKRDTLARLGGDEFGVLMEGCSIAQARRVADALRQAIENFRFLWEHQRFSIGVSIGLVPISSACENVTQVLRAADTACYAAKDEGRNRIHVYQEGNVHLARRHGEMRWVTRINRALEEGRFHLDSQPILALGANGNPGAHYELLLRMDDEDGRSVLPSHFLPAAERYQLGVKLDRWVIDAAFRWLRQHRSHLERLYLCDINLSGHAVADQDFLTYVVQQLHDNEIPPEKICFEITETAAISSLASAIDFVQVLRGLGCRFALDDFGSGLSSFAYLRNLPVDFLKIDGMFVREIVKDPINRAMVKSINEIGQAMGKKTVAEFVETSAILDELKAGAVKVDFAQGYAVGRPQPIEALA
jgi:diguanylate cyclase (GGDEF)-like protein/PAS domain S-box-containing protein